MIVLIPIPTPNTKLMRINFRVTIHIPFLYFPSLPLTTTPQVNTALLVRLALPSPATGLPSLFVPLLTAPVTVAFLR